MILSHILNKMNFKEDSMENSCAFNKDHKYIL